MSDWKWNRKYAAFQEPSEKVNDPAIGNRLATLLSNSSILAKDKEFVSSLDATWKRFSSLTKRQYDYFEVVEKRYDPVVVSQVAVERQKWIDAWDDWKRFRFQLCCKYYFQTEYFRDLAERGIKDQNFIPTEKQFNAMCENNYAKRLIDNMTNTKFESGDVVQSRSSAYLDQGMVGTVLGALDDITRQSANIGGRKYRVLWMTTGQEQVVLEKEIRKYRNK